jgi:hypothetical protein
MCPVAGGISYKVLTIVGGFDPARCPIVGDRDYEALMTTNWDDCCTSFRFPTVA